MQNVYEGSFNIVKAPFWLTLTDSIVIRTAPETYFRSRNSHLSRRTIAHLHLSNGYGVACTHCTVSFDWFLSGWEWILNLEFCLQIFFWYFTRNYNRISDLGLIFPHFEFLSLYLDIFDQNHNFLCKKLQFWSNISKYRPKNSKCGRVKPRSDIT